MSNFDEDKLQSEEDADEDSYITLTDDEGNNVHFKFLDLVEYQGRNYDVLLPFDDLSDEVVILEVLDSDDSEMAEYMSVESEEILNAVFDEFKKRHADEFDFED